MKDKIKRFIFERKELLVFIAVVLVVFTTVVSIATMALQDVPVGDDDPIVNPNPDGDDDQTGNTDDDDDKIPAQVGKFELPVQGEYVVVRTFYDSSLSDEKLVSAIIVNGSYMIESKGISYAMSDNSVFKVSAIYDGTVISVEEDELYGTTVAIRHSDDVVSIYSSLSDVTLKVNDQVKTSDVIGKATTSLMDTEAGVHVHLEIKIDDEYVNPASVFGKELEEVSSSK